jgi:hypothetical protein
LKITTPIDLAIAEFILRQRLAWLWVNARPSSSFLDVPST